ncbi:50S ribosomal protein L18 [Desulfovibrio ferrophilus]|uniref:Large ribosomal subunit protein uL18 n=1 Tax=Desulfovibrio ferrophilus TaxID=241368 RepID=A0A2Z6AV79_9BACT|nr:50S ribosomal protein L18 [Desulfovibrio ferrophilus]BBD07133.1 50S ribosomal protein L18 [Desulfovibrio ferrophilus]
MKLSKNKKRLRRKVRIRKKVNGTSERPRLCVYRSSAHIYAQLVNDEAGETVAATSTQILPSKGKSLNKESATEVGREIAKLAKEKNVESVVFDRNGYLYHGRVKALADGAREGGLKF